MQKLRSWIRTFLWCWALCWAVPIWGTRRRCFVHFFLCGVLLLRPFPLLNLLFTFGTTNSPLDWEEEHWNETEMQSDCEYVITQRSELYLIITVWCLRVCRSCRFTDRIILLSCINPFPLCQRQKLLKSRNGEKEHLVKQLSTWNNHAHDISQSQKNVQ